MYNMIDAEFFVSCMFFIICILVLNIWLMNLFVAVITNTFQAIRSQTQKSAFGATPFVFMISLLLDLMFGIRSDKAIVDEHDGWAVVESDHTHKRNWLRDTYQITRLVWPCLAVVSLGLAASKTANTGPDRLHVLGL